MDREKLWEGYQYVGVWKEGIAKEKGIPCVQPSGGEFTQPVRVFVQIFKDEANPLLEINRPEVVK